MAQQSFKRPTKKQLEELEAAYREEAARAAGVSRPVLGIQLVRTVKLNISRIVGNLQGKAGLIANLHRVEQNTLRELMSGLDGDIAQLIAVRHMEGTEIPTAWNNLAVAYNGGAGACGAFRQSAEQLNALVQQVDE